VEHKSHDPRLVGVSIAPQKCGVGSRENGDLRGFGASQLHITDNSTFFFDGTSRHLSYFDELQREEGYQAVVEMPAKQMASSHAMKRFFRAFAIFHAGAFRWVLQELFLWRLRREKMRVVMLTLDTMVMDNDEALQREGCDPTYKKVKGFQPLQLIWEGKIVDAIFRRGKRHSNYGHDVEKMIRGIVSLIRTRYDASVAIIVRLDAGFCEEFCAV